MISRLSDTPAKIIAWNLGGFLIVAFSVWRVDRDEGVGTSTVVALAIAAVICAAATRLHIRRLNRALDAPPHGDGATSAPLT